MSTLSRAGYFSNWSGGLRFKPQQLLYPESEAELQALVSQVRQRGGKLRVVGAGHSFTPLIETEDCLVSLDRWSGIERIEIEQEQVWVRAGTRLSQLNRLLADCGLALANLGDIDTQSIAGAISTGTHGTGALLQSVSAQVRALRLLSADGQIHLIDASHPWFEAARVSLGTLGIVTAVALKVQPAYRLKLQLRRQRLDQVLAELDQLLLAHRHVEFFVFPGSPYVQLKLSDITEQPSGARLKHQLNELFLENMAFWALSEISRRVPASTSAVAQLCGLAISDQQQIDDSHRIFANQRWTKFEEMEYCVPRAEFKSTLRELLGMIASQKIRVHFPIECRFVQSDSIWLSPSYQREAAYLAVHQYRGMPWQDYFQQAEALFLAVGGRPHWGKRHFLNADQLAATYPKWHHFCQLRSSLDPDQLFLNPYLAKLF